ncbi:hypothetical protein ACCUM_2009 [Candidatus Accumulibacter phosphatis]|uniref:Uncharacterized protein n=2 Tax=Candidatus Accumulibacter phosphatis TaxID=327160 RepID=A0A5S4EIC2_9PROT|nr:hypothetical protein ACCUM_2009 [Candidatus Accumulibacter phosphatis]
MRTPPLASLWVPADVSPYSLAAGGAGQGCGRHGASFFCTVLHGVVTPL